MALSFVQYTGNGSQETFAIPFPYLQRENIEVRVALDVTAYTWDDDNTIRISPAPANGAVIEARRVTPRETRLVDFVDGSVLTESDLDLANLQTFYIVQEAIDIAGGTLELLPDGSYGAGGRRIKELGNPVEDRDAVTKEWAETAMSSQLTQAIAEKNAAVTARTAAEAAQSAAAGSASAAASSASTASSQAGAADSARAAAVSARDAAQAYRDAALGYRNEAQGFRNEAETFRNQASTALDDFTDLYLGRKTSDPTVDNDGNALQIGALYFREAGALSSMRVWTGSLWKDAGSAVAGIVNPQVAIATAGQTVFPVTYDIGAILVFLNGVKQRPVTDFTASDGLNVTFTSALAAGDVVDLVPFGSFVVADTLAKSSHGADIVDKPLFRSNLQVVRDFSGAVTATNGMTAGSSNSGLVYNMNLAGGVQTLNLPASPADGFSVVVRATGLPSGYQTAYVDAGSGKTISYRGFDAQLFHLIGKGEVFRFTWLAGLNLWLAECIVQPGRVRLIRGLTGSASWNSGVTTPTQLIFNANNGDVAPFSLTSINARVPVIGNYSHNYSIYVSAAAGGGATGMAYLGNMAENGAWSGSLAYHYTTLILGEDSTLLNNSWSSVLNAGEYSGAFYSMSSTAIWWYPANSRGVVELLSR